MIQNLRNLKTESLPCKIEIKNITGIGGFCSKAKRKIDNEIRPKYPDHEIAVFFCYDTDSFEFCKKPPVDWNQVVTELENTGITKCYHIKARQSIESWFLLDLENVCRYLRIPTNSKVIGKNDYEKLSSLFKKGHKLYSKGKNKNSKAFIEALDINEIMSQKCTEIKPLCRYCGIKCNSQKSCKNK